MIVLDDQVNSGMSVQTVYRLEAILTRVTSLWDKMY